MKCTIQDQDLQELYCIVGKLNTMQVNVNMNDRNEYKETVTRLMNVIDRNRNWYSK